MISTQYPPLIYDFPAYTQPRPGNIMIKSNSVAQYTSNDYIGYRRELERLKAAYLDNVNPQKWSLQNKKMAIGNGVPYIPTQQAYRDFLGYPSDSQSYLDYRTSHFIDDSARKYMMTKPQLSSAERPPISRKRTNLEIRDTDKSILQDAVRSPQTLTKESASPFQRFLQSFMQKYPPKINETKEEYEDRVIQTAVYIFKSQPESYWDVADLTMNIHKVVAQKTEQETDPDKRLYEMADEVRNKKIKFQNIDNQNEENEYNEIQNARAESTPQTEKDIVYGTVNGIIEQKAKQSDFLLKQRLLKDNPEAGTENVNELLLIDKIRKDRAEGKQDVEIKTSILTKFPEFIQQVRNEFLKEFPKMSDAELLKKIYEKPLDDFIKFVGEQSKNPMLKIPDASTIKSIMDLNPGLSSSDIINLLAVKPETSKKIEEFQNKITDLENKIKEKDELANETQISYEQGKISQKEQEQLLEQATNIINNLNLELNDTKQKLNETQSTLSETVNVALEQSLTIDQLNEELEKSKINFDKLKEEEKQIKTDNVDKQSIYKQQINDLKNNIQQYEDKLKQFELNLTSATDADKEKIRKEINDVKNILINVKTEKQNTEYRLEKQEKFYSDEINRLNAELKKETEKNEYLNKSIQIAGKQLITMHGEKQNAEAMKSTKDKDLYKSYLNEFISEVKGSTYGTVIINKNFDKNRMFYEQFVTAYNEYLNVPSDNTLNIIDNFIDELVEIYQDPESKLTLNLKVDGKKAAEGTISARKNYFTYTMYKKILYLFDNLVSNFRLTLDKGDEQNRIKLSTKIKGLIIKYERLTSKEYIYEEDKEPEQEPEPERASVSQEPEPKRASVSREPEISGSPTKSPFSIPSYSSSILPTPSPTPPPTLSSTKQIQLKPIATATTTTTTTTSTTPPAHVVKNIPGSSQALVEPIYQKMKDIFPDFFEKVRNTVKVLYTENQDYKMTFIKQYLDLLNIFLTSDTNNYIEQYNNFINFTLTDLKNVYYNPNTSIYETNKYMKAKSMATLTDDKPSSEDLNITRYINKNAIIVFIDLAIELTNLLSGIVTDNTIKQQLSTNKNNLNKFKKEVEHRINITEENLKIFGKQGKSKIGEGLNMKSHDSDMKIASCSCKQPKKGVTFAHKRDLSQYGYKNIKNMSEYDRHVALATALKGFYSKPGGQTSLTRKLNALSLVQKKRDPKLSQLFKEDVDFVSKISHLFKEDDDFVSNL